MLRFKIKCYTVKDLSFNYEDLEQQRIVRFLRVKLIRIIRKSYIGDPNDWSSITAICTREFNNDRSSIIAILKNDFKLKSQEIGSRIFVKDHSLWQLVQAHRVHLITTVHDLSTK